MTKLERMKLIIIKKIGFVPPSNDHYIKNLHHEACQKNSDPYPLVPIFVTTEIHFPLKIAYYNPIPIVCTEYYSHI